MAPFYKRGAHQFVRLFLSEMAECRDGFGRRWLHRETVDDRLGGDADFRRQYYTY